MEKSIANVFNQLNMRFSTIFFDLDNTLIATRKADQKTCNKVNANIFLFFFCLNSISFHLEQSFFVSFSSVKSTLIARISTKRHKCFVHVSIERTIYCMKLPHGLGQKNLDFITYLVFAN